MAQQVTVQLVDDLDGSQSDAITTVTFGLDGVTYEIDLNEANAGSLRAALAQYVSHARRTGGRMKRGTAATGRSSSTAGNEETQAAREWARENGYEVSSRGRLSASIMEAYKAAQAETTSKPRKRRARASA